MPNWKWQPMDEVNFPTDYLQINDLYRWESKFERGIEFQSDVHLGRVKLQSRHTVEPEMLDAQTAEGEDVKVLRTKVTLGIRVTFVEHEGVEPELLHLVEATFAVEYIVLRPLDEEQIQSFCKFNCIHNVWPFWRQYVFDTLKSASLPVVSVPFFPGNGKKPKRRTKAKMRSSKQG